MSIYHLMNAKKCILVFEHVYTDIGNQYKVLSVPAPSLLPIDLQRGEVTAARLSDWVERRVIPVNRHHMEAVLSAINLQNRFEVLCYSHGMSLNDAFWVQEVSEGLNFDEINLYDHPFDEALGWIAFTGIPSNISRHLSTPETTTEGVLPKYWHRISDSDIILCKGGTEGYYNAGLEPFAEVVAYLIAKRAGINAIPYHLEQRKGRPVSISKLFTTKERGLFTAGCYLGHKEPGVRHIPLQAALEHMQNDFGDITPFYEMCFFDCIIENGDRHLNNWGFSVENATQEIRGFAPLWDNGAALDYERSEDMRAKFTFASFGVRYDFLKTCPARRELTAKARTLVAAISDGSLEEECNKAVSGFERYEARINPTLAFVEKRCRDYIENLSR
ncbi:MAG: HipA domain-containing protein [Clostridiales bacterium]|nr:HipA domain-containing protein [Clostridiales bacterium]